MELMGIWCFWKCCFHLNDIYDVQFKARKKKIILLSSILLLCLHTMGMTYNAHTLCTLNTYFFCLFFVPNFSFEIARLI